MKSPKIILAGALAVSLGGCAESIDRLSAMHWTEMAGTLGGAALGGYAGAQMGGGLANTMFISTGVLVGGAAGFAASRMLPAADQAFYEKSAELALNSKPDGEIVRWQNAETGRSGIFRSVASYTSRSGQYCRQYRSSVVFDDGVFNGDGTACQQADGNWLKLHDEFS